jgi:hypothetical protein
VAFFQYWEKELGTPAAAQARLAAQHARNAQDEGLRERTLDWYLSALTYGREPARTIAEQLDAIALEHPGSYLAARLITGQSEVARLERRLTESRRLSRQAIETFRALGLPGGEAGLEQARGRMCQPASAGLAGPVSQPAHKRARPLR